MTFVRGDKKLLRSLVMSTFIHSYVRGSGNIEIAGVDHDTGYALFSPLCQSVLSRAELCVAVSEGDADLVVAWTLAETHKGLLHYVWVRSEYRRSGVASSLLDHVFSTRTLKHHTFETLVWRRHVNRCDSLSTFRPEALKEEEVEK